MTASELLGRLRRDGFSVRLAGDMIAVRPSSRLDPTLRELIRAHRAELLALLASEPAEAALAAGDLVWLTRPDGGTVNVMEAWTIDAIVDSPEGPLAIFLGRPYASWPLAFCRRASEVRYPPTGRATE